MGLRNDMEIEEAVKLINDKAKYQSPERLAMGNCLISGFGIIIPPLMIPWFCFFANFYLPIARIPRQYPYSAAAHGHHYP